MKKLREPKILQGRPRKLVGFTTFIDIFAVAPFKEIQDEFDEEVSSLLWDRFVSGMSLEDTKKDLSVDYPKGTVLFAVYQLTDVGVDDLLRDKPMKRLQRKLRAAEKAVAREAEQYAKEEAEREKRREREAYKKLYKKFKGKSPEEIK